MKKSISLLQITQPITVTRRKNHILLQMEMNPKLMIIYLCSLVTFKITMLILWRASPNLPRLILEMAKLSTSQLNKVL